ncbi:hypothetical protein GLOTRDRAFT_127063 [Gloeophyllum trabeum ATCC 11539]|uniref:Uncharacterized protein n=1 Tax=Gloeophyllum trabeum (strain ATCC 11539 / FP-39264 / Madison 617) TaxID=670483 RepID=S7RUY8_GLOTA|nr:uncharacterized protein GLOTRDRAFT_127063 [Gloeophyllum trabeum ATCC 11539]EPQ58565.1 hypothetical protein GLOTRDRAFT_127063 [Gloeophyllum trabeum ATCC 11539]
MLAVHRLLPTRPPLSSPAAQQTVTIQGRWKDTRASLHLPPLADTFTFPPNLHKASRPRPPSRIDLRRRDEEAELHFTEDALREQSLSLEEMGNMFRAVVLAEKENARTAPATRNQARKKGKG